jgi:beta-N-acetylhexosaminidase
MAYSLLEDAHAVLFPAFASLTLSDAVRRFLDRGGVSILLGEERAEYVAREMSATRRAEETAAGLSTVTTEARQRSGLLLVAVDQELGGICRLHDLVPQFPPRSELETATPEMIAATARLIAGHATGFGVNLFLSPVLDVLDGANPWLSGRTWSSNPDVVARLSSTFISAVQAGGVAATAKHFPGFRSISADPATDASAMCQTPLEAIDAGLVPFAAAVGVGVEVVMVGPAIVQAIDATQAALRSPKVVRMLKERLGFKGLVMADDLDSQATMRGDNVSDVAIDALNAGCDFLLVADLGTQVGDVAVAIAAAADSGRISREALANSAAKVRALAKKYATARSVT